MQLCHLLNDFSDFFQGGTSHRLNYSIHVIFTQLQKALHKVSINEVACLKLDI